MPLDLAKLTNVQRSGADWVARCPQCAAEGADTSGNHLIVYADGRYGCAVNRTSEHYSRIYALAGVNGTGASSYQPPPEEPLELPKTWPVSLLDRLVKDHSYWVNRGVPEHVLEPLKGGVATVGSMARRYVFPIFNDSGEIVGFTGRALDPKMQIRWKHMGTVSSWIWGDVDEIAATRQAILVEGAGCRLALNSRGIKQSLPLWSTHMSEAVLGALIAANPTDIVIALNRERSGVGLAAAIRTKKTLDTFFDEGVARIGLPLGKDFLDQTEAQWTEWLGTVLIPLDKQPKTEILS